MTQLDRQEAAVDQLRDQSGHAPYLARYIFDAAEARRPSELVAVDAWVNTALNSDQKSAVQKVLSAPDLCLVQGPPGTGKTTVIAESITQETMRDETVLVASQTHTAVDNALGRLALDPSIRAVRLTRNKDKVTDEGQEFLDQRALRRYYSSLAQSVASVRERASAGAEFASRFTRFQQTATRHVLDVEQAEVKARDASEKLGLVVECYRRLLGELRRLDVKVPTLRDGPGAPDSLADLDLWLGEFEQALRSLERQLGAFLDGRSSTAADTATGRRRELAEQLAAVEEKMENDDSVAAEWRRLRVELKKLGEESPPDPVDTGVLTRYFAHVESLTEPVGDSVLDRLTRKRQKQKQLAKTVLDRVGVASSLLTGFNELMASRIEQQASLREAELRLESVRRTAANFFCGQNGGFVNAAVPGQDGTAASLRALIESTAREHAERVSEAASAVIENDAWGDIREDWAADLVVESVAERDWELIGDLWLAECNVVGVTCNENPKTLEDVGLEIFDLAIIDEVSKATPLELLQPMLRTRRTALVGDHRQLPPMFRESHDSEGLTEEPDEGIPEELALTEENRRKYEKFVTASVFRTHFERADESIKHRLTVQHRMHPDIMDAVNRFYEGQLTSGIIDPDVQRAHRLTITGRGGLPVISPEKHMIWVDTTLDEDGRPWRETTDNSSRQYRTNIVEARLIARMLRDIDDALLADPSRTGHKDVGVVTMHPQQLQCIRQAIKKETRHRPFRAIRHETNTVVRYQGKEKPIILVSMVRNFGPSAHDRRPSSSANFARFEYINVAFSRAQELLVVFGAKDTLAPTPVELPPMDASGAPTLTNVYREIIDGVQRNGAFKQAGALVARSPDQRSERTR